MPKCEDRPRRTFETQHALALRRRTTPDPSSPPRQKRRHIRLTPCEQPTVAGERGCGNNPADSGRPRATPGGVADEGEGGGFVSRGLSGSETLRRPTSTSTSPKTCKTHSKTTSNRISKIDFHQPAYTTPSSAVRPHKRAAPARRRRLSRGGWSVRRRSARTLARGPAVEKFNAAGNRFATLGLIMSRALLNHHFRAPAAQARGLEQQLQLHDILNRLLVQITGHSRAPALVSADADVSLPGPSRPAAASLSTSRPRRRGRDSPEAGGRRRRAFCTACRAQSVRRRTSLPAPCAPLRLGGGSGGCLKA